MQLTPEQIESILNKAKPSIIAGLTKEVTQFAQWEMHPIAAKMIQEEVQKFMSEEIIPIIRQQLFESKEGLISLAISSSNSIVEELAKSLAESVKKTMENTYDRRKVFEVLFK